jgi:hypothetical protein
LTSEAESNPWGFDLDISYYDLWHVRRKGCETNAEGFYLQTNSEAKSLCDLLNKLENTNHE